MLEHLVRWVLLHERRGYIPCEETTTGEEGQGEVSGKIKEKGRGKKCIEARARDHIVSPFECDS